MRNSKVIKMSEEEPKVAPIYNNEQIVGRTRADLVYSVRYYLGLIALAVVLYIFRNRIPSIWRLTLIIPATVLGLFIGLLVGLREAPPRPAPIIILKPLTQNTARVFLVWDSSAISFSDTPGVPIGTTFGSIIRLAKDVYETENKLIVEPSSLHHLALENPVEALAHVRSLDKLAEELDTALQKYIELYVSTRASARQLARRRVSELLSLEKNAEKAAKKTLKKALEEKKEKRFFLTCLTSLLERS